MNISFGLLCSILNESFLAYTYRDVGAIVGALIGSVAFIVIIIVVVTCCCCIRRPAILVRPPLQPGVTVVSNTRK